LLLAAGVTDFAIVSLLLQNPPRAGQGWLIAAGLIALCLALTYFALACVFNRTAVSVKQGRLRIRHGPMPWPGNRSIPIANIDALALAETFGGFRSERAKPAHAVCAVLTDGRHIKIVGGPLSGAFVNWAEAELCRLRIYLMLREAIRRSSTG
jgi:hypothetical protein